MLEGDEIDYQDLPEDDPLNVLFLNQGAPKMNNYYPSTHGSAIAKLILWTDKDPRPIRIGVRAMGSLIANGNLALLQLLVDQMDLIDPYLEGNYRFACTRGSIFLEAVIHDRREMVNWILDHYRSIVYL